MGSKLKLEHLAGLTHKDAASTTYFLFRRTMQAFVMISECRPQSCSVPWGKECNGQTCNQNAINGLPNSDTSLNAECWVK